MLSFVYDVETVTIESANEVTAGVVGVVRGQEVVIAQEGFWRSGDLLNEVVDPGVQDIVVVHVDVRKTARVIQLQVSNPQVLQGLLDPRQEKGIGGALQFLQCPDPAQRGDIFIPCEEKVHQPVAVQEQFLPRRVIVDVSQELLELGVDQGVVGISQAVVTWEE